MYTIYTERKGIGVELTRELAAVGCSLIGAIEMSYVESRIILRGGAPGGHDESFWSIYWRLLTVAERCLYWTGLPMLFAPIIIALTG